MCTGTAVLHRIPRGHRREPHLHGRELAGAIGRSRAHGGSSPGECIELMRRFMHGNPDLWNEDIGVPAGCLNAAPRGYLPASFSRASLRIAGMRRGRIRIAAKMRRHSLAGRARHTRVRLATGKIARHAAVTRDLGPAADGHAVGDADLAAEHDAVTEGDAAGEPGLTAEDAVLADGAVVRSGRGCRSWFLGRCGSRRTSRHRRTSWRRSRRRPR